MSVADIAQQVATRPEDRKAQLVNVALNELEERLAEQRALVVRGAAKSSVWAFREEFRLTVERLFELGTA